MSSRKGIGFCQQSEKPLYKGFCFLLSSKILTFRELNVSLFKAHSVIFASYTRA